jgi:Uma2 family endonuclease
VTSDLIEQVASGEAPPLVPLTVEQLHRMLEKGIIRDGDPIELVEGLLVRKNRAAAGAGDMAHGTLHAQVLTRLVRLDPALDSTGCLLRIQLPVTLSTLSEPEPDLAIVRGAVESFTERHPGPGDVLAIVEVADSSLGYDRRSKLRVYASAGIPVYLIVNIPERQIEYHEEPVTGPGRYRRRTDYGPGETLVLPLGGDRTLTIAVDDAFGPAGR